MNILHIPRERFRATATDNLRTNASTRAERCAELTSALLDGDTSTLSDADTRAVLDGVHRSIAAMSDVIKAGTQLAAWMTRVRLRNWAARYPSRMSPNSKRVFMQAMIDAHVPLISDYLLLCRALGLAEVHELRASQRHTAGHPAPTELREAS